MGKHSQLCSWKGTCSLTLVTLSFNPPTNVLFQVDFPIPNFIGGSTMVGTTNASIASFGSGSWDWFVYCVRIFALILEPDS